MQIGNNTVRRMYYRAATTFTTESWKCNVVCGGGIGRRTRRVGAIIGGECHWVASELCAEAMNVGWSSRSCLGHMRVASTQASSIICSLLRYCPAYVWKSTVSAVWPLCTERGNTYNGRVHVLCVPNIVIVRHWVACMRHLTLRISVLITDFEKVR